MYFGECAISNHIDIVLYENDNIIRMVDDIFNEDNIITEANLKDIGKSVWSAIVRIFRTIRTAFQNLLTNVNYFKNSEMDEQQNKDLLYVLKTIDLKALNKYQEYLPMYFRIMHKFGNDVTADFQSVVVGELTGGVTDFEFEIQKGVTDIEESLEAGKSSEEYKRIQQDDYKNEKMTKVPLSNIIPDMKDSNSKLTKFINELEKQSSFNDKITEENKDAKALSGKMITYLRKLVEYFKFRISLLQHYFKSAKASIDAVKNNIKEKKAGENKSDQKFSSGLKNVRRKNVTIKDVAAFKESQKKLKEYNSNLEFDKYKEEYKKFTSLLGVSNTDGVIIINLDEESGKAQIATTSNKYEKINVGTRKLYHHSAEAEGSAVDQNILSKGLKPNALGNKSGLLGLTLYYPEPRVYIHLSIPRTPGNNKVGNDRTLFGYVKDFGKENTGCVYEIEGNHDVYRDPEYSGTAAFIISDKPIKCKRVDMDKWYKDHEVEDANKKPKEEKKES